MQGILDLVPAGGAWTLIGTSVASASASLTVTGLDSTYDTYAIAFADIVIANAGQNLLFRMGDSGGVDSGSSDYSYHTTYHTDATATYQNGSVSAGRDHIILLNGMGDGQTGDGAGGMLYLHRPGDGTMYPMITGQCVAHVNGSDQTLCSSVFAQRLSAITLDRVQLLSASGNIDAGRLTVWGIAHA